MTSKNLVLSVFLAFGTLLISTTSIQAQTIQDVEQGISDVTDAVQEGENYIHVVNKTNKEIFVEYDHDLIKRKYYGTWVEKNKFGKPYRPWFQSYNYTIYVKEKGGSWSQVHAVVCCKQKSQLVTVSYSDGDFKIKVEDYRS